MFLRTDTLKESLGIGLREKNERKKLIDEYAEQTFIKI